MIPSQAEIVRSVYGAMRLALLDPQGMTYFDLSIGGFWRSFWAAVLLAPFFMAMTFLYYDPAAGSPGYFLAVKLFAYAVSWIAFPVAMVVLAQAFALQSRYVPFIVAYNWSQVVIMTVLLPLATIMARDVMPMAVAALLSALVLAASFGYLWFIARTALAIGGGLATAVTLGEFLLTYLIQASSDRLM